MVRTLISASLIFFTATTVNAVSPSRCTDVCPMPIPNTEPVCGSDGVTYPALCAYNQAVCANPNLTKVKDGPCEPCPVICPPEADP
ncbi:hypothetical protein HDU67_000542, partial [Dinochytrium kinnereticum]